MEARLGSWWQKIRQRRVVIAFTIAIFAVAIALIIIAYSFDWSGFNGYIQVSTIRTLSGPTAGTVTRTEAFQPGKALWDWMQLLIIPAVLAVSGFVINLTISRGEQEAAKQRSKTEREIADDNQHEATLQGYIDKMSELLLHEKLRESHQTDEVQSIARARTLTMLPRLDGKRKGSVLQFLYESKLIEKDNSIVALNKADLSRADLHNANLSGADLFEANLYCAHLAHITLSKADLGNANLFGADLFDADLGEANLSEAILINAHLSEADLFKADLSAADLSGCILIAADLRQSCLNATDLSRADLSGSLLSHAILFAANLSGAILQKADLSEAILGEADLSGANLRDAKISAEQLEQASSLKGATMPDGTIHP